MFHIGFVHFIFTENFQIQFQISTPSVSLGRGIGGMLENFKIEHDRGHHGLSVVVTACGDFAMVFTIFLDKLTMPILSVEVHFWHRIKAMERRETCTYNT